MLRKIMLQKQGKKRKKMEDIFERLSGKKGPFIIADIGSNHGGNIEFAKKLIDKAKEAGVDAVKFQSFTKENINSKNVYDSKKDIEFKDFGVKGLDKLHDKIILNNDAYRELKKYGSMPIKVQNYVDITEEYLLQKYPKRIMSFLSGVYEACGRYSAFELVALTHQERGWIEARKGLSPNEPSKNPILDKYILAQHLN